MDQSTEDDLDDDEEEEVNEKGIPISTAPIVAAPLLEYFIIKFYYCLSGSKINLGPLQQLHKSTRHIR